jgi:hypothetical protein
MVGIGDDSGEVTIESSQGVGLAQGLMSEGGWAAKGCVARENGSLMVSRWTNRKSNAGKDFAGKDVAREEEWSLGSVLVLYAGQGRQQSVNLKA